MMNRFIQAVEFNRARRGMTMIELAIALGVISLILGAMWLAAGAVHRRAPISDTVQLINEISTNVRALYTGQYNAQRYTTVASQINFGGFYPAGVLNEARNDTINGWGGTIIVRLPAAVDPLNGFSIEFNLPADMSPTERRQVCGEIYGALPATAVRNPATGAAWATTNTLPSVGVPQIEPSQRLAPSLAFLNIAGTGWVNVTGRAPTALFGAGGNDDCEGFAFYYRL